MALPNDSFQRAPDGSGTLLATHLISSKEYPVGIAAGPSGHIEGSLPTYFYTYPPVAVGASKIYFDFFNADAALIVKVRGIWVIVAQDVANTAAVSLRLDWLKTSAVGTGGTAATYNGTSTTAATVTPKDSANAALDADITARTVPTGGATTSAFIFPTYHAPEELQVHGGLSQFMNVRPDPSRGEQELTFRQNQGFKCVQGTVAAAGNIGFLMEFTVE